jgi:protocatechuate 3,4-dioxygenase beta subunit
MFKLIIAVTIFLFNSHILWAKNIPSFIESPDDRSTAVDYNDVKPLKKRENKAQNYSQEFFDRDKKDDKIFIFSDYIKSLQEKKNINSGKEEIEKAILEFKQIPGAEVKLSHYFNTVSLKAQLRLKCPVTPTLKNIPASKPENFSLSNNLRRVSKSPYVASGDIIYVQGTVRDVNCTPIPNAVVQLWQTDAYGNYKNQELEFLGSATAVADNLGNFSFITILPKEYTPKLVYETLLAPHLNLNITHNSFPELLTRIYFPEHVLNDDDVELNSLDPFSKDLLISELVPVNSNNLREGYFMYFDVTLDGVSKYRRL